MWQRRQQLQQQQQATTKTIVICYCYYRLFLVCALSLTDLAACIWLITIPFVWSSTSHTIALSLSANTFSGLSTFDVVVIIVVLIFFRRCSLSRKCVTVERGWCRFAMSLSAHYQFWTRAKLISHSEREKRLFQRRTLFLYLNAKNLSKQAHRMNISGIDERWKNIN